jgi:TRAP-type C4-dicarboxylate transport system permease small subunit
LKILRFLDARIEEFIIAVCLGAMTIVIGFQVFMRYVLQDSLSWSEELSRYLFIFFVYAGVSYGVKKQRHIRVEAFTMWMSARKRKIILLIADILFLVFAVIVVGYGYLTAARIFRLNQLSPALDLPMGYVYATLPLCFVLVAIRLVQNITRSVREFTRPREEGGNNRW